MILYRILLVAVLLAPASGYNYCNNKTHACNLAGMKHFMCRLDEDLRPLDDTRFHDTIPDSPIFQTEVLGLLNNYRDILASGELTTKTNQTYPSAKRMRRLIWDKELAYMARVHASTVSFRHSKCRSTLRFPIVGECLAMMAAPEDRRNPVLTVLRNAFREMWKEHNDVEDPERLIDGYDPSRDYSVGHFTVIISDRASRVGCGMAVGSNCPHGEKVGYCHFVTCYFDFNNVGNSYVYKPGEPASGCDDWKTTGSDKWSHLCKNIGEIFPSN